MRFSRSHHFFPFGQAKSTGFSFALAIYDSLIVKITCKATGAQEDRRRPSISAFEQRSFLPQKAFCNMMGSNYAAEQTIANIISKWHISAAMLEISSKTSTHPHVQCRPLTASLPNSHGSTSVEV